jgi:hypothetical protein
MPKRRRRGDGYPYNAIEFACRDSFFSQDSDAEE